jgi:DNA topoisomerase-1
MKKHLVIVESPAKIKTLKKFLGPGFTILSSIGHIRDLPAKEFGIDIDHEFEPKYVNLPDKKETIDELKKAAKEADLVYLSPDPDREGEAIAWHIAAILPKNTPIKRMVFYSITKSEVLNALKNPREIDLSLVNAQQARRLLDRMVGYKISPILNKKLRGGKNAKSAGRVQSVALKLIVDREKEIENFKPIEYWNIKAIFQKNNNLFEAYLYSVDGKKVEKEAKDNVFLIPNQTVSDNIVDQLNKAKYKVKDIEKKEKTRNPVAPFITSTLQQEASRHFNFPVAKTMNIAQSLYEGIDMKKEGTEGLITYMRTDSVQTAPEALDAARNYILKHFGKEFLPEAPNKYISKKSAQEAHEAIRPTNLDHPPEKIKMYLTTDQYKLYSLIWKRFIASQMTPAIYDSITIEIETDKNMILRSCGSTMKFAGFMQIYQERNDHKEDSQEGLLPELSLEETLLLNNVTSTQSFTKPPARFTEASLVKELEKSGIGRPSTYAAIMNKIQSRDYTTKKDNTLMPTELGKIIVQMLEANFEAIMNVDFTASMEDQLELVAENKKDWKLVLKEFWQDFFPMVEKAQKEATIPKQPTDIPCPKCKKMLQKVWFKGSYFYGCSGYPKCDFSSSVEAFHFKKEDYDENFDWDQNCPKCGEKMILRHGKFGSFLGCSKYPKCKCIVNIPKKGEKTLNPEDMPHCPALGCDGKIMLRKTRRGKFFYSCSNFPDCDVIVNDLNDLTKKYDEHHPKTAYQKREKGKPFTRIFNLSPELQAVIGEEKATRQEVLKKLWEYIKGHKLQDPKNKRHIVPDEKLTKVFGSSEPIDMMALGGILKNHLK